ncbi:hypothetical protein HYG77_28220 [Rhodococcus sp. ZPP]|uniref:DoxX family protein n=1 Tax=Rhodococcus sp. ZPP TaxID=2749906 RepID=UPI001AD86416|nr:hypothetical protein [Rhodococcus sp. ZPP]QTJ69049.1 hypothetical protein HYG77_28220 [Rhodococcus sp. ZPP]
MQRVNTLSRTGRTPALRLAALLLGMGVLHFVTPKFFDAIVPERLPGDPRTYTYASGVAELTVGAALVVPRTRRLGGGLAALLFLAVYPANISMAVDWLKSTEMSRLQKTGVLLRLPLQIPLVTEALKVRRQA